VKFNSEVNERITSDWGIGKLHFSHLTGEKGSFDIEDLLKVFRQGRQ
jgi:hypothetical protein